jgi:hypothetical protein
MITFQRHIQYGGDPTKAAFESVTVAFHVPVFEYVPVSADVGAARRAGLEAMSTRIRGTVIEGGAATGPKKTDVAFFCPVNGAREFGHG